METFYDEEPDTIRIKELALDFLSNLKLVHNKIGYDKNTLKFLNAFHKEITELFFTLNMQEGIIFLYNYDDKNQQYYERYLNLNE